MMAIQNHSVTCVTSSFLVRPSRFQTLKVTTLSGFWAHTRQPCWGPMYRLHGCPIARDMTPPPLRGAGRQVSCHVAKLGPPSRLVLASCCQRPQLGPSTSQMHRQHMARDSNRERTQLAVTGRRVLRARPCSTVFTGVDHDH